MKNKKIATLFFVFIILGVFYFIYRAIQSDYSPELTSIENQTQKIEDLETKGLQDFEAQAVDGSSFKLSSIHQKVVILNFWASWCGPCVQEFPSLLKLVEETNGQVALIAVSLDNDEKQMADFLRNYNVSNPNIFLLKDPSYKLAESFGTMKLPESYILNSDRKLIKKVSGSIDWSNEEIKNLINNEIQK
jgi:cytochrome c biogenesis protein CcmG/thiol:disulfide interchange protein DsbE